MEWTLEGLTELIYRTVCSELLQVEDGFSPQADLIAAGLDSLAVTQLMLAIEERTGHWVDESKLIPENLQCCEALARCVHAELGNA